jgi:hypothetical protein
MKFIQLNLVLFTLIFISFNSFSQTNLNFISAGAGCTLKLFKFSGIPDDRLFYPEVQIGGNLLKSCFLWSVYYGYWKHNMDKPGYCCSEGPEGCFLIKYSTTGHICGLRLTFIPSKNIPDWKIPISFFIGFSHHFISNQISKEAGVGNFINTDDINDWNPLETGLRIDVQISKNISVFTQAELYFPFMELPLKRISGNIGLLYNISD